MPSSVNCLICNKPETIEHIFHDCHDAVLWDVLRRTLKKELPLYPFGIRSLPCAELGEVQSVMLMLLCMQSAWQTSADVKHAHVPAHSAKHYFVASVMYTRLVQCDVNHCCDARLNRLYWPSGSWCLYNRHTHCIC